MVIDFSFRRWELLKYVNLGKIDYYVRKGILNPKEKITIKHLQDAGIVKKVEWGVKVLGLGAEKIDYPINLEVTDASKAAIEKIQ